MPHMVTLGTRGINASLNRVQTLYESSRSLNQWKHHRRFCPARWRTFPGDARAACSRISDLEIFQLNRDRSEVVPYMSANSNSLTLGICVMLTQRSQLLPRDITRTLLKKVLSNTYCHLSIARSAIVKEMVIQQSLECDTAYSLTSYR